MKKYNQDLEISQLQLSLNDFLISFNKNMPASFPTATASLLEKFKESHAALFKNTDLWSLDIHRKKLIDWLPRNV